LVIGRRILCEEIDSDHSVINHKPVRFESRDYQIFHNLTEIMVVSSDPN
jgi:hypothetical protein